MAGIELVIFDCDGVLVDSERIAVRVETRLLNDLGWEVTEAELIERFVGRSDAYFHEEIERALDRPVPGWPDLYRAALRDAFEAELVPVPGVVAALDALDLPVCIASSGSHDKMRLTLGLTGLLARFGDRIFSGTEVANGKPAPDLFLLAAARCGVAPQRCAVVEDSRFGVEAARAAGMHAFGYCGGLTPREWLTGDRTVVFDDMADLPRLLRDRAQDAAPDARGSGLV